MDYVRTERGKLKLCVDSYLYVKQKSLARGVLCYECEKRRDYGCKAKLHIMGDEITKRVNEHNHAADPSRVEALNVRYQVKRRAEDTDETPQQILTDAVTGITDAAASHLPELNHMRRNVRRYKQIVGNPEPVLLDLSTMEIPQQYRVTFGGDQFLLHDSGDGPNGRMLLFSTQRNMRTLATSDHWFADGTFKVVPSLFYQLYTIHAFVGDRVLPCVYALLPNKTQETYTSLFRTLIELDDDCDPDSVLIDFEPAAKNGILASFPNVNISGCFYHLSQCVYRRIQNSGLQGTYQDDAEFALFMRMIPALAFIPQDEIEDAVDTLSQEIPAEGVPILDYFEDTFLGRRIRNGRRAPVFPASTWTMYQRTLDELPRTNNNVEGWHRRFQSAVCAYHPNIWKFLDILKKEQAMVEVIRAQVIAGNPPPAQRKRYQDSSRRIKRVVDQYEDRHVLEYLRGIAMNFQF